MNSWSQHCSQSLPLITINILHFGTHRRCLNNIVLDKKYKFVYEPRHEKMCLLESPTRQDTNWLAQLQRPVRILKFRIYKLEESFCLGSEQQRRWSACADAQADLRLCCSHMAKDTFSHGLAYIKLDHITFMHMLYFLPKIITPLWLNCIKLRAIVTLTCSDNRSNQILKLNFNNLNTTLKMARINHTMLLLFFQVFSCKFLLQKYFLICKIYSQSDFLNFCQIWH